MSRMPSDLAGLYNQFVKGKAVAVGALAALIILAIIVAMVILVIIYHTITQKTRSSREIQKIPWGMILLRILKRS